MLRSTYCLVLLLALSTVSYGQVNAPSAMPGGAPASDFPSEGRITNLFFGSISASSTFDDNVQNSPSKRVPGGLYYLSSMAGFQVARRNFKWKLDYAPSMMRTSHGALGQFGQMLNQQFGTVLELDPTTRWKVRLQQDYLVTTDPFQRLANSPPGLQVGLLSPVNQSIGLPELKQTTLASHASIAYRLSRRTTVEVGGFYDELRYSDVLGGSASNGLLFNSKTADTNAFVSYELSSRQSIGIEYQFSRIALTGIDEHTLAQDVLLFDQIRLGKHHSLTLFAGPQYARTSGQFSVNSGLFSRFTPVRQSIWSPAAGLTYTISTDRNMFQATYMQAVSGGSGFMPAARMRSGSLGVGRRLTSAWRFDLNVALTRNVAFGVLQPFSFRTIDASGGFSRTVRNNITVRLAYERLGQSGNSLYGSVGNHNRALCSVGYSFSKPLGK